MSPFLQIHNQFSLVNIWISTELCNMLVDIYDEWIYPEMRDSFCVRTWRPKLSDTINVCLIWFMHIIYEKDILVLIRYSYKAINFRMIYIT